MHWQFGEMEFGEMKHVELEQFWHAFTSRGFDSVSCAFLLLVCRITQLYKPAFCHAFIKRILID